MNYEQKYLKYKKKYLELKFGLDGGALAAMMAARASRGPQVSQPSSGSSNKQTLLGNLLERRATLRSFEAGPFKGKLNDLKNSNQITEKEYDLLMGPDFGPLSGCWDKCKQDAEQQQKQSSMSEEEKREERAKKAKKMAGPNARGIGMFNPAAALAALKHRKH